MSSRGGRVPERASELAARLSHDGGHVRLSYQVDGGRPGAVDVRYPWRLGDREASVLPVVGVGVATYLGQLCLASRIEIDFSADPELVAGIAPIAEALYDIRCWKDQRDLVGSPTYVFREPARAEPVDASLDGGKSLLLFSGGKDSTLATFALRRNEFAVQGLHVTINAGVEAVEGEARRRLSERLDLEVSDVAYDHPQFRSLADRYAANWASFPHYNTVPFGRDLVLGMVAIPVLVRNQIGNLSFGHDNDCRNSSVTHRGKVIPRNDIESRQGGLALEAYIRRFALEDCRLLPPLARLSEHRILREMLERHPDAMADTSFCFWGQNCGRCAKCLRYFLAQRLFRCEGALSFTVNPLGDGACPELAEIIEKWGRERVLFDTEVVYALGRLVERGDLRPGERMLERFRDSVYSEVVSHLDRWETELNSLKPDPQTPDDFVPVGN